MSHLRGAYPPEEKLMETEHLKLLLPKVTFPLGKLLIGVSGGADSMALLHLALLAGCDVMAVHVNHDLRGEESDGDEAFVRSQCEKMGVPLRVCRAVRPAHPSENWAREVRYGFFREVYVQEKCTALLLAHHADDQAETLLMRLMRGSGLTGLCAMRETAVQDGMTIVRPLLRLTRQELREALTADGLTWREDGSNDGNDYLRNRVRHELLPLMEQLLPGSGRHIAQTALALSGEEEGLQRQAEEMLAGQASSLSMNCLPLDMLCSLDEAMCRRILRLWWQKAIGGSRDERTLSFRQTEEAAAQIHAPVGTKTNLPGGYHFYTGMTHLHLVGMTCEPLGEMPLSSALPAPVRMGNYEISVYSGKQTGGCILPRRLLDNALVRARRSGDYVVKPAGRRKLQDVFQDLRIDAPLRSMLPLVCVSSRVYMIADIAAYGEDCEDPITVKITRA